MTFAGTDLAYDRFMGRYSSRLAPLFADFAGIEAAMTVLDVGCGPGALTGELVRRAGEERVAAADPTEQFVSACRARFPGTRVEQAPAEELPFADGDFDAALAQLVVAFMSDGVAGVREMARVTRAGGVVAACMWVIGPEMELLHVVHGAGAAIAPDHPYVNAAQRYRSEPELLELFEAAGIRDVESGSLVVSSEYADFDELWDSVVGGAGPIGDLLRTLDADGVESFRSEVHERLGDRGAPFTLSGRALAIRGVSRS